MPLRLLERLCCAHLPMHFKDDDVIEKCVMLHSAGMIDADLPPVIFDGERKRFAAEAIVMCVTPRGYELTRARHAAAGEAWPQRIDLGAAGSPYPACLADTIGPG